MVLLRGNNLFRVDSLNTLDIDGARSKGMHKGVRQRAVPLDPLNPAYQPIEPLVEATSASPPAAAPMRAPRTEIAQLFEEQGALAMQGRRTRKEYRRTNDVSDIEEAAPRPLLGRNGEGKLVTEYRDGLATWSPAAEPAPEPAPAPAPAAAPGPSLDEMPHQERLAAQLLSSGFSAAEAQRIMRRASATGGRAAAARPPGRRLAVPAAALALALAAHVVALAGLCRPRKVRCVDARQHGAHQQQGAEKC